MKKFFNINVLGILSGLNHIIPATFLSNFNFATN